MSRIVLAVPLLLLASLAPLGAANFRLSDGQAFSDVYRTSFPGDLVVTPDGRWVFYVEDADVDDADELWRVPAAGGEPVRVSGLLPAGAHTFGVELTPDAARVVYRAPQDDLAISELYSAPVGAPAGSYVKINTPAPAGLAVWGPGGYSPDAQRLVYGFGYLDPVPGAAPEIRTAGVDGSQQSSLVTLPAGRELGSFAATPDFTRVVYLADAAVAGRRELWSVATAGGTPVRLNGALVSGGRVDSFDVSRADGTVVYVADQQVDERFEAYAVPPGGGAAIRLNGALATGHVITGALFAPGGGRVLLVEYDAPAQRLAEIWSVAPDGSGRVGLIGAMVAGGQPVAFALDSAHVVFVADKLVDETYELFSVPLAGGAVTKLNGALPAGGDVVYAGAAAPKITPDGSRVIYAADQAVNGLDNVYSVPIGGGTPVAVGNEATLGVGTVRGLAISADGTRVARVLSFRLLPGMPTTVHLAVAPLAGGPWRTVDSCPVTGEVWPLPVFAPGDSRRLFYVADQEVDEQWELFYGDVCLLCDGFEAGSTVCWSFTSP